jgi:hypothetical protein
VLDTLDSPKVLLFVADGRVRAAIGSGDGSLPVAAVQGVNVVEFPVLLRYHCRTWWKK